MSRFGELLRLYRDQSRDRELEKKNLTQARLAELLSRDLRLDRDHGYTAQTVSNWERGKYHIPLGERRVLIGLVRVLYHCQGLSTLTEANTFLESGGYRGLDHEEIQTFFAHWQAVAEPEPPVPVPAPAPSPKEEPLPPPPGHGAAIRLVIIFLGELVFRPSEEIRELVYQGLNGPPPHWPRIFLMLLGWPFDKWSAEKFLQALGWISIWLSTWTFTLPMMMWPFANDARAWLAAVTYIGAASVLPLGVGILTRTGDEFWHARAIKSRYVRLYTYQGAFLGFHIGYAIVFLVKLVASYPGLSHWGLLDGLAAAWPVVLSYAAARQIPFNLWRAYGRLQLDGNMIFFVFVFFPLGFGLFFWVFHPILLTPEFGIPILLSSAAFLAALTAWQRRRTGSGVIPVYVWIAIWGIVIVLSELITTPNALAPASTACLFSVLALLSARNRIHATFRGLLGFALVGILLVVLIEREPLLGRIAVLLAILLWLGFARQYLWFPLSFWATLLAISAGLALYRYAGWSDGYAALLICGLTMVILFAEWRRPPPPGP